MYHKSFGGRTPPGPAMGAYSRQSGFRRREEWGRERKERGMQREGKERERDCPPWFLKVGAYVVRRCMAWLLQHSCLVAWTAQQSPENGTRLDHCATIRTRSAKKVCLLNSTTCTSGLQNTCGIVTNLFWDFLVIFWIFILHIYINAI